MLQSSSKRLYLEESNEDEDSDDACEDAHINPKLAGKAHLNIKLFEAEFKSA